MSEYVYYGHPRIVFTLNSIAFCNMKHINGKKSSKRKMLKLFFEILIINICTSVYASCLVHL